MRLDEKKKEKEADAKEKAKQSIREELGQSRKRKLQLQTTEEKLIKEVDTLAENAEKNNMTFLVKSNALRLKSKQKRKEIDKEDKNIERLEKKLKSV